MRAWVTGTWAVIDTNDAPDHPYHTAEEAIKAIELEIERVRQLQRLILRPKSSSPTAQNV